MRKVFPHFQGPKKPQRSEEVSERSLEAEDQAMNMNTWEEEVEEERRKLPRRSEHPAIDFCLSNFK